MKPVHERRGMVEPGIENFSITRQCNVLGISRSGYYYEPAKTSPLNLELMDKMDRHYQEHPYKGARRMHVHLTKDLGYNVSRNRVERLYYEVMNLRAIWPGPHTSKRCKAHKIYPYLLRELKINEPNQVWATDITYIGMKEGYMYLIAIIDLYSRFVVNWSLSNTMDARWCAECYNEAIIYNNKPSIINTDQGSQFTSIAFTEAVVGSEVKLSMDGKGRATDNAFIETLWKTVKYEHVFLSAHQTVADLYMGLSNYFYNYNYTRRHSSVENNFPASLYEPGRKKIIKKT